jgi:hypothetical protein
VLALKHVGDCVAKPKPMGILPSSGSSGSFHSMETMRTMETKVSSSYLILYFGFQHIHIDPSDMRTPEAVF